MKHDRYPPTHVYNDTDGLGRQVLDHAPNRTTDMALLDIPARVGVEVDLLVWSSLARGWLTEVAQIFVSG
jgi:hypothetical protein